MKIIIPDGVTDLFSKRIHLLIVEDDENLLSILADLFSTPYITVTKASNITEAKSAIARHGGCWHCWIIDMCLDGKRNSGMALIEDHGFFPFTIVYSGIGSMECASYAMRKGAEVVIDKGFGSIVRLIKEVCGLAPLAALCKGSICKNKEILFLLKNHIIRGPKEWAEHAVMTLRQLQNISTLNSGMPPTLVIPFYYGLRYLLLSSLSGKGPLTEKKDGIFYQSCVNFLWKNLPSYQKLF